MDEAHMEELFKESIAFIEKGLGEFPLGAQWLPPTEEQKSRYKVWVNLKHKELVKLEKIVHTFAPDFPTFMRMITNKQLLVAHRREVLRAYGYECFEDTIGEEFDDEEETNGGKEVAGSEEIV